MVNRLYLLIRILRGSEGSTMLADEFYVDDGTSNAVKYVSVPSAGLNVRKFKRAVAPSDGSKSFFELKITEDGKGNSAQIHYLISKVVEVPGPDLLLRPAKINFAIHIPTTKLDLDREELVKGLLSQLLGFLLTANSTISSPDVLITSTQIPTDRLNSILNGEI